jgi:hypothetical protein
LPVVAFVRAAVITPESRIFAMPRPSQPMTNLAGYQIYDGTSVSAMTHTVRIANSGIVTYVISNLSPATWYFSVKAYAGANVQSSASVMVSKTID